MKAGAGGGNRSSLLLVDLLAQLCVAKGPDAQGEHACWCPFHADGRGKAPHAPSLYVSERGFHCFGCGQKGSLERLAGLLGVSIAAESVDDRAAPILEAAVVFYSREIPEEVRAWLHKRTLTEETIRRFRLGYAGGGLRQHIEESKLDEEKAREVGLVRPDGRDYFYRTLIIPYLTRGRVIGIRARTHPSDDKKAYFPLPGFKAHLFNPDILGNGKIPVVAEGELDGILLSQLGFAGVGVPGVTAFRPEWVSLFMRHKSVCICFDADDAGRTGAEKVAQVIGEKAKIVSLPDGLDATEYFQKGYTREDFVELLQKGKTYLERKLEDGSSLSDGERARIFRELVPYLARFERIDLETRRARISETFGIRPKIFDQEIEIAQRAVEERGLELDEKAADDTFNEEEIRAGQGLLASSDLLKKVLDVAEEIGCVGEDLNKTALYLSLTSRLLEQPISIVVKGESAAGKSHLVQTLTRLFPRKDVLEFTAMSAKALFHRKDDLSHKVLVIYELPGAEESDYSIRTLQSEGKIIYSAPAKDEEGHLVTVDREIAGPVSFIETTTKARIHQENETRCFELFVDESPEQTARIFAAQNRKYDGTRVDADEIVRPFQALQTLLRAYPVFIPYVRLIDFPTEPIRVRRDRMRFLALIEASALLHQEQREKRDTGGVPHLVANLMDYGVAYELARGLLGPSLEALTPKGAETVRIVASLTGYEEGQLNENEVKASDVLTRGPYKDIKSCRKFLAEAYRQGFLDRRIDKKTHFYRVLRMPVGNEVRLLSPSDLRARIEGEGGPMRADRSVSASEHLTHSETES